MKALKFEELTLEQKFGLVIHALFFDDGTATEENIAYTLDLVKKRALGAVWIPPSVKCKEEIMKLVKDTADYPVIFFTEGEKGFGEYAIGSHHALSMAGSEELAYNFGKVTGIAARESGFNVVCAPLLDVAVEDTACGGNMRSLGNDKHKIAAYAKAIARGLHDGGVLTLAKHYPSATEALHIDSHMAEGYSIQTKEELIDFNLHSYIELTKAGLLDGIMTGHTKLPNIDPVYPASISKKVIDIIREQGFDGLSITDGLTMMGVQAKFGMDAPPGLAIAAGNDLPLTWTETKDAYERVKKAYEEGVITPERLDEAVKRVIATQEKILALNTDAKITEKNVEDFNKINSDGIYAKTDEGVKPSISKDGKHLFAITVAMEQQLKEGKLSLETMTDSWYKPELIAKRLLELFPNSAVHAIPEFPTNVQNFHLLDAANKYDDVIFINFAEFRAFGGSDHITQRLSAVVNALIVSEKVSTVLSFGNPYVLEDLYHVERILLGTQSTASTMAALEVLAGNYPAKGTLTYDVNFQ